MGYFSSIYENEELSGRAKCVYVYLRDRAWEKGFCYPSIGRIAKELKISKSTVQRALHELEDKKIIKKDKRWRENGSQTSNILTIK